ncbi:MAG TPA: DNA methyltransferase, partial [Vulgatibacter sp.]
GSGSSPGSAPVRGTKRYLAYIQDAYLDQAKVYAALLPEGPPPLLVVVDVGHRFWIWRGQDGKFDAFHSPRRLEFGLDEIGEEENARSLWACFEAPEELDPSRAQQRITEEAAQKLAPLAAELEAAGHDPEEVARFLMRCLFCMFAEDVELLPASHFSRLLESSLKIPEAFEPEATNLFRCMDEGGLYNYEKIRRFNGALFRGAKALPLGARALRMLADAASLNWAYVDPAIFGTLLERALDPRERHRLGAHYTPRTFVERIVRATIEDPLRAEWDVVQTRAAEVRAAEDQESKANDAARKILLPFLRRLHDVRVLDPACGTGNFLYVAYAVLKELEHEVLSELALVGGAQLGIVAEGGGAAVMPSQMLGIEVKPWAAEIAQLVLWIGHLQWELFHQRRTTLRDPILPEERSISCHDALVEWDEAVPRLGDDGQVVTRWDGTTRTIHHATGKEVPDTEARVPVVDYVGVRRAPWPDADFVVGNPPFIGNKHMREVLGDAYVEALRGMYEGEVPNTVDLVMYWWHRAAALVRAGEVERMGLITTNSLVQTQNRQVTEKHLAGDPPLGIVMAIPDHPWVDAGADVRISMTVAERSRQGIQRLARLGKVVDESKGFDQVEVE